MQKISSYLYPNRIQVVADVTLFSTRWNIVYQNRVKIYKGVDNVLTIDVKNADQKRIDLTGMNINMGLTDVNGKQIAIIPATITSTKGLATVNITPDLLSNLSPQFLNFTLYRVNSDTTKTVLYADTQFGAKGNMELVSSAVPVSTPPRYITRFLPLTNTQKFPFVTTYYSDAVEITEPNFVKSVIDESIVFTFETDLLSADVTIEFTEEPVISSATVWKEIETFEIYYTVAAITKVYAYPDYNREYRWARVRYKQTNGSTGTIKKVIVTFEPLEDLVLDGGAA